MGIYDVFAIAITSLDLPRERIVRKRFQPPKQTPNLNQKNTNTSCFRRLRTSGGFGSVPRNRRAILKEFLY